MAVITEINGKSTTLLTNQVDEVNGTERVNIDEINGQVSPVPVTNFITDKLFLYYDFDDQQLTDISASNQVYDQYSAETGVLAQDGHDAIFKSGTSATAAFIVNQTINGATVKCTYQDGVNDRIYKSAYGTPDAGTGGNHGVNTYGIGPQTNSSGTTNSNYFYNDGFSIEVWFKNTGDSADRPNLWSRFGNSSVRLRFQSYLNDLDFTQVYAYNGSSVYLSNFYPINSSKFPANTWHQQVFTLQPTATTNTFTMRLYKNGQLIGTETNKLVNPTSSTNDKLFLGCQTSTNTSVGIYTGYIGLVRCYQKKISNSEVLNNYIFNRSRFGI